MRNYEQWGIIALFFASTFYFLYLSFSWMRKGKPARWKNGYTVVRLLGVFSVVLWIAAIVSLAFGNELLMWWSASIGYLAAGFSTAVFITERRG